MQTLKSPLRYENILKYVARDILEKYGNNLSDIAVVFPNKRAALFLNESLARLTDHPIWSPSYITISDLFRKHSTLKVGDPIKLVCDLHKTFVACTGIDETLDHFYGWGQLLITDFDDIDKNMAEAEKLFANLSNIHELDDISYLTEEQKTLIKKFLAISTMITTLNSKRDFYNYGAIFLISISSSTCVLKNKDWLMRGLCTGKL